MSGRVQLVWRVQAHDGRGPFRPGFSATWVDESGPRQLPSIFEDFSTATLLIVRRLIAEKGGAAGCGCEDIAGISQWFTPLEQCRLATHGYRVMSMQPDRIIAKSRHQVLFWRRLPLNESATQHPWPAVDANSNGLVQDQPP